MAIIRWSPVRDLMGLQDDMGMMFNEFFGDGDKMRELGLTRWHPRVDITEEDNRYELTADLPGIKKEDIKVEVRDNVLTLRGEKKMGEERKEKNCMLSERYYGEFTRTFTLPENVDRNAIDAAFKDGVLHLSIPKTEKAKPKQIEVKVK